MKWVLVVGLVLFGSIACGAPGQDDPPTVVADGSTGVLAAPKRDAVIVGNQFKVLEDDVVSLVLELPAALEPAMSGFGPIVAAVTADQRYLAYLGWDPAPGFSNLKEGEKVQPGTPLGVSVLHLLELQSGKHVEVQGVQSFSLRSNGDVAYAQTSNPLVLSQTPQDTRLVHRSATGDEIVVSEVGFATSALWSGDQLLYTTSTSSEPGPFTLMTYSVTTGQSARVGEDLSPFVMLDDGSVILVPNYDSFLRNFQRYDVPSGELVDLSFDGPEDISQGIRVVGLGLVEDGWILFHGQREPSAVEVVGRMTLVDGAISVSDVMTLDARSVVGIEQVHTTQDGSITGWGLNPKAMPTREGDVGLSSSLLVAFTCNERCEYREVDTPPAVHVAVISEGQR